MVCIYDGTFTKGDEMFTNNKPTWLLVLQIWLNCFARKYVILPREKVVLGIRLGDYERGEGNGDREVGGGEMAVGCSQAGRQSCSQFLPNHVNQATEMRH